MEKKYIVSIDLGGTKVLSALIDENIKIVRRVKIETEITKGKKYLVETISECVKTLMEKSKIREEQIKAICMGVPGTVNPEGIIGNAPNLGIKNYDIRKALQKYFTIPVYIENDVNLAALGIKRFEFKNNVKNMLVVFVGTGIGGALIFDGKLYRGSSFYAGEIGHMIVSKKGSLKNSSNSKTIFESLASRTAIVNAIEKEIKNGTESKLAKTVKRGEKIKSKALLNAVNENDELTIRYISKASKTIGTVLGSITTLLNIDTIVLGGGVIEALEDYMIKKIKEAFDDAVLKEPGKGVVIKATKLGDDAALYGGFALSEEFIK